METTEIIISILFNLLPLIILIIPLFFIWKKTVGKLYFRIIAGILVFFLVYWILPIIFQVGVVPKELALQPGEEGYIFLGIGYIISHFTSLLTSFASYPLVTLPFIFFIAPFISMIIVWNHLRKEKGSIKDNLKLIAYPISDSPYKQIREGLTRNNWAREKEILKLSKF